MILIILIITLKYLINIYIYHHHLLLPRFHYCLHYLFRQLLQSHLIAKFIPKQISIKQLIYYIKFIESYIMY